MKKQCKILIPTGEVHVPENNFQHKKKEAFLIDSFIVRTPIKSSLRSKTERKLEI